MAGKKAKQTAAEIEDKAERETAAAHEGMKLGPITPTTRPVREPAKEGTYAIAVDRILVEGNQRQYNEETRASIRDLAESIRCNTLLQPIGVVDDPERDCFVLAYGERRLLAAIHLGMSTIDAKVARAGTPIEAMRLAENVDRKDWTPVEEALACGRVLDEAGGNVDVAAAKIGKSPTWVRDRKYINRLDGKVRDIVVRGYLPLEYARELAKIADPRKQEDLARRVIGHTALHDETPGVGLQRLEDLQKWVAGEMYSLKVVPWKLDVAFAGRKACSDCEFNSGNDLKLFEHGTAPEESQCLHAGCFEAKQRAAQRQISDGVAKVVEERKENKELQFTVRGLGDMIPSAVKESTFVRQAQKAIEPKGKAKEEDNKKKPLMESDWNHPKNVAQRKWETAVYEWELKTVESVVKAAKSPLARVCLMLLANNSVMRGLCAYDNASRRRAEMSPRWRQLIALAAKGDEKAVASIASDVDLDADSLYRQLCARNDVVAAELAQAFGIDAGERPALGDFWTDEHKAAAKVHAKAKGKASTNAKPVKSAKKPAGKKVKKATGKKPAKRKAGAK